ncbi:unnamed protein product [Durusdinium trenchii]|uniref:Uncharacterized protein n=1 Tax=Durusdinium trenchii TaxID=1381693 RepID=A0ABP0IQ45_9DINO
MKMHEGIEGICVFASPCCLQGQYGLDATFVHSLSPKDTAFRAGEKLFGFTMQVVLTLASEGSGRCEWGATHFCWPRLYVSHSVSSRWRKIAEDGQELQEVVSSTMPALGNLAIHGLTCNNELAHRVFWDEGRRLALVLFCRSPEIEALLKGKGAQSRLSMRYWWRKEHEKVK